LAGAFTQLCNRRKFKTDCEFKLEDAGARGQQYLLIVLNLHQFKTVNDSLGQLTGDKLLQQIARKLMLAVESNSVVARMGGDEFSVLQSFQNSETTRMVVDTIVRSITGTVSVDGQIVRINACAGYALYPKDAATLEDLRKAADLSLYHAKQKGAGTICAHNQSIASAFQQRQSLETDLSRAIEREEFELHYQPQFDLRHGAVEGVEALLRWNHPERGSVSPFQFIPVAEDAGLLPVLGQWVIEEAARQAGIWQRLNGMSLRMSVNVSVQQFLHRDIAYNVSDVLERHNLSPQNFEIEITESVAMAEIDRVLQQLQVIREQGVRVALDDFGTGYSSLGYLQDLPLDTLKIDRSFITKLDTGDGRQRVLLDSIANIARSFKFHTVAEGVETDTQLHHVRALGIDTVQGYYYSKPLPAGLLPNAVQQINTQYGDGHRKVA